MAFCVPAAPKVKVITKSGIARRVFIDGNEVGKVTDIDIQYGINCLPTVRISFLADVEIEEKDVID